MEWTSAALLVALQCCIQAVVGLMLFLPMVLGNKDGWYKAYYQKNSALYENLNGIPDYLHQLEIQVGSHLIEWAMCTAAALFAGADAQILCIIECAPMLCMVLYFFKCDEKVYGIISLALVGALGYFGFVPSPEVPSVEWEAADGMLGLHMLLVFPVAIWFISGVAKEKREALNAHSALLLSTRERQIIIGTTVLGMGCGNLASILSNVGSNYCLLAAPQMVLNGVSKLLSGFTMTEARDPFVIAGLFVFFGLLPHVMQ